MNPQTVELALALIDIIKRAHETLVALRDNDPATYDQIAKSHAQALEDAKAAL